MRKKLFILPLAMALLAFPALADDAAPAPEPSAVQQETAPQPSTEVAQPASCESSVSAAQKAAFAPLASEPFQGLQPAAGASCGGAICGKFEYCCNPSCALCVPLGMSCTQESCN
ncbi:MAG: hypothetical protein V3T72_20850 [Thermoanaerobaculia bacterium]